MAELIQQAQTPRYLFKKTTLSDQLIMGQPTSILLIFAPTINVFIQFFFCIKVLEFLLHNPSKNVNDISPDISEV